MKKLIIILAMVFLIPMLSAAETWHPTDSATIAWDAVTVPDGVLTYLVYVKNVETGELLGTIDTPNGMATAETANLQQALTFSEEGRYYIGVASKRIPDGQTTALYSDINWSNVNGESTPNPFGVEHFVVPSMPLNLRKQ